MCNTGKSFGQKMHCGRVCEAILGRLGVSGGVAVGIAWAGGRRPSGGAVATVCRRGGGAGASFLQLFCSRMQIFPEKVLAFREK